MPVGPNGQEVLIPDVYISFEVIRTGLLDLQPHAIPVIVGTAKKGIPVNSNNAFWEWNGVDLPRPTHKTVLRVYDDETQVGRDFGFASAVTRAFHWYKLNGGTKAYVACANVNTQTTIELWRGASRVLTGVTNVYGAESMDGCLEVEVNVGNVMLSWIPVSGVTYLTQAVTIPAVGTNFNVKAQLTDGLYVGKTVYLVDNLHGGASPFNMTPSNVAIPCQVVAIAASTPSTPGTVTLVSTDAGGQTFDPDQDARMFWQGSARNSAALTTLTEVKAWLQAQCGMTVTLDDAATDSDLPDALSFTFLHEAQDTGTLRHPEDPGAPGTYLETWYGRSPTFPRAYGAHNPPDNDWAAIGTGIFDHLSDEYDYTEQHDGFRPNMVAVSDINNGQDVGGGVTTDNALSMVNFAKLQEALQPPEEMLVFTGHDIGQFAPDSVVDRTALLNYDGCLYCVPGIDDEAPCFSNAPQVMANVAKSKANHNLTNDRMQGALLEFPYSHSQKERLIRAGACATIGSRAGLKILKGINTLQNNTGSGGWNPSDNTTWLPMQWHMYRYFRKSLHDFLYELIGQDSVSDSQVLIAAGRVCETFRQLGIFIPSQTLPSGYKLNGVYRHASNEGFVFNPIQVYLDKELNYLWPAIAIQI